MFFLQDHIERIDTGSLGLTTSCVSSYRIGKIERVKGIFLKDRGQITLGMFDINDAFDTVDHAITLKRLDIYKFLYSRECIELVYELPVRVESAGL